MEDINEFIKNHSVIKAIWPDLTGVTHCPDISPLGHLYEFSPGNGIVYRIIAMAINELDFGILGSIEPGWLIVNGQTGRAHLFANKGYLDAGYVTEKLYRKDDSFSIEAIQCITALIGFATKRETSVKVLHLGE